LSLIFFTQMQSTSFEVDCVGRELTFAAVVENALQQKWIRDPFDRLIVAQASTNEAPLVTKDEKIRRHYRRAVW
jgi:PIN domain nuclease of toxin-antitoxin system